MMVFVRTVLDSRLRGKDDGGGRNSQLANP